MIFPIVFRSDTASQFNFGRVLCVVAIQSMLIACQEGKEVPDREKKTIRSMKSIAYIFHSNSKARSDLVALARRGNVSNAEIVDIWEDYHIKPEHEGVVEIDQSLADGWRMPFRFEVSGIEDADSLSLKISSSGPNKNDDHGNADDLRMEFQIYPDFVVMAAGR
ncbi:MAG: hypothetical protein ACR2RV_12735 [Verrucomicrobiales bacterium]